MRNASPNGSMGSAATSGGWGAWPTSTPAAPPRRPSARFSVINWRSTRARPAPSANRTAISRWRPMPRATSRFPTFMQAISSTSATTVISRITTGIAWRRPTGLGMPRTSSSARGARASFARSGFSRWIRVANGVQLGGGLRHPDAALQAAEHHGTAVIGIIAGPVAEGHPKIDAQRRVDAGELRRRDPDHGIRVRFRADGLSEHAGVAMKELLPCVVADDRRRFILAREPTAQGGARPEHGGVIGRHGLSADQHGVALEAEVGLFRLRDRQAVERLIAVSEGAIFGIGEKGTASAAEHHHAIGVAHRQRPEIDGVEKAEDGGVHPDAER